AEHRAITRDVHQAFRQFFGERPAETSARPRLPSRMALSATGFADPERALQNLRMIVAGRPLVPYPAALRTALTRLIPPLLDASRSRRGAQSVRAFSRRRGAARGLRRTARRATGAAGWAREAVCRRRSARAAARRSARAAGLARQSERPAGPPSARRFPRGP